MQSFTLGGVTQLKIKADSLEDIGSFVRQLMTSETIFAVQAKMKRRDHKPNNHIKEYVFLKYRSDDVYFRKSKLRFFQYLLLPEG